MELDNKGSKEDLIPKEPPVVTLEPTLTLLDGVMIIVGVMIGSGIFISPASVLVKAGSVGFSLIAWVGSGIIALFASLCYVELGTMIPKSGGEYTYLNESFGEIFAFVFNFANNIMIKPAMIAIIILTFGEYLVEPFITVGCSPEIRSTIVKLLAALCLGKEITRRSTGMF